MLPLLAAVILWGLANFLLKVARISMNTSSVQAAQVAGLMIAVFLFYSFDRQQLNSFHEHLRGYALGFLAGGLGLIGTYFFLYALGVEKLSFASQFSSLYVIVSALLGFFFLKETFHIWEVIGGLLMVIGAILLGVAK